MTRLHLPFRGYHPVSVGGGYDAPRPHRASGKHEAVDWPLRFEDVYAVAPGKILQASSDKTGGNYVGVQHPWGYTYYRHLSSFWLMIGYEVSPQTERIAISGESGTLTEGPHLHVEFMDLQWKRFNPFDPPPGLPGFPSA